MNNVAHPAHVSHALREVGEDLVRGGGDAVEPVVEDQHPFVVPRHLLVRVVDDERTVEAVVQLRADVGVEPVGARMRGDELVCELSARGDGGLGYRRDSIHVVAEGESVPVHGGVRVELVADGRFQRVACGEPDYRGGDTSERPGGGGGTGQVERGGGGGEVDGGDSAGAAAVLLRAGHRCAGGCHPLRRGGAGGEHGCRDGAQSESEHTSSGQQHRGGRCGRERTVRHVRAPSAWSSQRAPGRAGGAA